MKRALTVAGVAAVLVIGGSTPAPAGQADCAAARSRAAGTEPGSPANVRLADEGSQACASSHTVASVPAASRTSLGQIDADRLAHLNRLLDGVTEGSPAHFRLIEERDELLAG